MITLKTLARPIVRLGAPALLALAAMQSAQAQSASEMTTDEITDAFNKQKTRGLVIVPSGDQPAASTDTTSVAPAATDYQAVAREDQINLQISFDFDSAALRADQKPKLAALCEAMQSVDVQVFQIIGHTDSSGSADYNENLSLLRAQEVKRHIVSDCGIPADRLEAIGLGETAPYNETDPRADENRRVEFQALG
ncbi:Outer membrane protein OmpA [Cribrihabitans marinus]|uniref:Outer membrane protein OmpA n=1 Tax=Cribrihabitans marinus TaxID=1227549 RepID=A0A1H7DMZ0_9RHOB|nr:OmpA family protein [Cribrihabitans marinus]SEK03143.1 Outer membrane protein OmpA [Cribrihabitans marinus]